MVQAVVVVPQGGDPGDGVKALLIHEADHFIHGGHADLRGGDDAGQGGAVIGRAVAALQVDHDGGVGLQGFQQIPAAGDIGLEVINVDEVAVQLLQVIGHIDGIVAFVVVNGNVGLAHGRHSHLADKLIGGHVQIQHGTLPGIDHMTLQENDAAEPGDEEQQQKNQKNDAHTAQHPLGAVGYSHRGLLNCVGAIHESPAGLSVSGDS